MEPSTPRLSEVARHLVVPSGIVTTAWPRVVAKCAEVGMGFDPWQDGIGSVALGKRADGKYAATVGGVVLSIPRQTGKTYLVGATAIALCLLTPKLTVLWTAHRTRTATMTFHSLVAMVKRKKIYPHVAGIRTANGEQEIRFRNGSVIMFGAREQGFGRGFDEVDVEVFDEAQILTAKALEDIVPAANQSRQESGALLFFMGTPPRETDPSEEFANRRAKALSKKSDSMVYVEFSADPGCDPDDRAQWAKANPSYPSRTPAESIERMRENLTDDDSFRHEALGIWDSVESSQIIPAKSWALAGDDLSVPTDRFALGIEVGPDQRSAAVCLAGLRPDGQWHIELDEHRGGASWVGPYVQALCEANPQIRNVIADVGGPVAALLDHRADRWTIQGVKVRVAPLTVKELGAACSTLLSGVVDASVRHTRQPQMATAVAGVGKRALGDSGLWVWSRASAVVDVTPIQAATYALHGAQCVSSTRPLPAGRGSSRREAVVM